MPDFPHFVHCRGHLAPRGHSGIPERRIPPTLSASPRTLRSHSCLVFVCSAAGGRGSEAAGALIRPPPARQSVLSISLEFGITLQCLYHPFVPLGPSRPSGVLIAWFSI